MAISEPDGKRAVQRLLARALRPFTRVRPEETATVALMTLCAFTLLCAYYLLKTVREPLVLLHGGAAMKLYLRAAQAGIMVVVVHAYGWLARRVGRGRLLAIVFLFFISNLVAWTALARAGAAIALPFFLWVGVFSYTVVAQFWALAADIYSDEQGKRLFPIIGGGSSIGAVVGGLFAGRLVQFGPAMLMGTAVVMLLGCVAIILWIERKAAERSIVHVETDPEEPISDENPWQLLARDRYLWLIACLVVFLNWVNSSGEYLLDRTVVAAAHGMTATDAQRFVGEFKANYFAWYNGIGLVLELFVVSRVLRLVGVRRALLVMPVFALIAYGSAVFVPTLAVMRLVKIGENSLQYSLQDTTRNALFLVASRVEKFVGKTAIDTIGVRLGAIMSASIVFLGTHLGWSTSTFAALDAALAAVWLGFAFAIGHEHRKRTGKPRD
ncbi:MAG TPA: Npt1/Npt2 family nucleotide transporter [Kofleriaceae bacterium]|nr:Npt1/Npt2 family nucleotide transporter [Kofleriaceae bacterium]